MQEIQRSFFQQAYSFINENKKACIVSLIPIIGPLCGIINSLTKPYTDDAFIRESRNKELETLGGRKNYAIKQSLSWEKVTKIFAIGGIIHSIALFLLLQTVAPAWLLPLALIFLGYAGISFGLLFQVFSHQCTKDTACSA
jgi:hypothetical protein